MGNEKDQITTIWIINDWITCPYDREYVDTATRSHSHDHMNKNMCQNHMSAIMAITQFRITISTMELPLSTAELLCR